MNGNTISMYYYEEAGICQFVKKSQNEICGKESVNTLHGKWYCGTNKCGHYMVEQHKYNLLRKRYHPLDAMLIQLYAKDLSEEQNGVNDIDS